MNRNFFSGMAVDQESSTESLQHIPEAKPLVMSSQVEDGVQETVVTVAFTVRS
uniref:Uncharacterized protein n=1 Tax=Brassica oleracea var. oleracea TaxID=109376 RepID=A0A0D3CLF8_BRAOL